MEILNDLGKKIENKFSEIDFSKLQNNFLNSKLGQVVNFAVDQGLRYIMPDFIEDEIIDVKNVLFSEGLSEAVHKAIDNATDLGKTAIGIFSGNFENISQAQNALKKGGIIDGISDGIDYVLNKLSESKIISPNIVKVIKGGKKEIINNIEKNIKNEFANESKSLNNLEKYINNWNNYYGEKNIEGLEKEFKKIKKEEKNILPIKNIISNIQKIKNIHKIINNSEEFDFDNIYLNLSEKLSN